LLSISLNIVLDEIQELYSKARRGEGERERERELRRILTLVNSPTATTSATGDTRYD